MSEYTGDPVATASQHEQEAAALELTEHPTVKAAHRSVAETWLGRAKASDAMRAVFDRAFAEVMLSAAVWSSNQDKLRPKVSSITRLGHPVGGRQIPGSRWGIDNPDSVYRVIPISGDGRYEIRGRVGANRMTENYFTLWDANMGTVAVLNGRTMEVDADGSFTNLAWSADEVGAMRNQVYVMGRFDLGPGEVFVVDGGDGGAEYFTVPLSNVWGTTLDIVDRTGSLNKAQSVPNEDGTYTYVISAHDPGVANWIDSDGLNEGILTLRMAEFGGDGPKEDLGARGRVVKLDDLERDVPTLRRVSAQERSIELGERRAAYLRRLPEGTI